MQCGVLENCVEIVSQMFWTIKISSVDEGARWEKAIIVCPTQHHRDRVQLQRVEGFLSDVVFTQSVLETQVKPAVLADYNISLAISSGCFVSVVVYL